MEMIINRKQKNILEVFHELDDSNALVVRTKEENAIIMADYESDENYILIRDIKIHYAGVIDANDMETNLEMLEMDGEILDYILVERKEIKITIF